VRLGYVSYNLWLEPRGLELGLTSDTGSCRQDVARFSIDKEITLSSLWLARELTVSRLRPLADYISFKRSFKLFKEMPVVFLCLCRLRTAMHRLQQRHYVYTMSRCLYHCPSRCPSHANIDSLASPFPGQQTNTGVAGRYAESIVQLSTGAKQQQISMILPLLVKSLK